MLFRAHAKVFDLFFVSHGFLAKMGFTVATPLKGPLGAVRVNSEYFLLPPPPPPFPLRMEGAV